MSCFICSGVKVVEVGGRAFSAVPEGADGGGPDASVGLDPGVACPVASKCAPATTHTKIPSRHSFMFSYTRPAGRRFL
jgi:hypothetical protein